MPQKVAFWFALTTGQIRGTTVTSFSWPGSEEAPARASTGGRSFRPAGRDAYWTGALTNKYELDSSFEGEAREGSMKTKWILLGASIIGLMLGQTSATASDANGNHDTYIWVVGATSPSDTAIAPDGSTITMKGQGTLNAGPGNTASGGGTYSLSSGGGGGGGGGGGFGVVCLRAAAGPPPCPFFWGGAKKNTHPRQSGKRRLARLCRLWSAPPRTGGGD